MQKRDYVKAGVEVVVSAGVGIIANNAVEMVTPKDLGKVKMTLAKIGAFAIVGMVSSQASNYVNGYVDQVADGFNRGKEIGENIDVDKVVDAGMDAMEEAINAADADKDETDGSEA